MRDGRIVADDNRAGAGPMSNFDDLVGVAWSGLRARKIRTLLIMLGPIIGVAAMVSAVGLTESAKGALQAQLSTAGDQSDHRPGRRHLRIAEPDLPRRRGRTGGERLHGDQRGRHHQPVGGGRAADPGSQHLLPGLSRAGTGGRRQAPVGARGPDAQRALAERRRQPAPYCDRWCSARGSPSSTATCRARPGPSASTVPTSAWSGCSAPVPLDPELDNAAFVTQWAAKNVFGTNGQPNQLYIRAVPGTTQATANAIPTAINLGGPDPDLDPDPERRAPGRRPRPTRPCSRWRCSPACWP